MTLRWYQQEASDAAWSWIRRCVDPCLIEAATGAGKSHIIADLSARIYGHSKKRVLVLAPSAELVVQNHAKYEATGAKASLFSASVGSVNLRHPVVFGTPGTVKNAVRRFQDFAAVIVDEAHRITPTVKSIIEDMARSNKNLRVIGLTATPYRMGTGYIYGRESDGIEVEETIAPYFHTRVYEIGARTLIDEGYLTPPVFDAPPEHYDTSGLVLNRTGVFDSGTVEQAFEGHGRKTAAIVADVVEKSRNRHGVMLFAATVQHGHEIMASLPPGISFFIDGKTDKKDRQKAIDDFKAKRIKYLVNVQVLTTGFDASHVDVIAILRATESVALLQQIIGRGLRIDDCKSDCLVLDYAENLERHCPGGDIFSPTITVKKQSEGGLVKVVCPDCEYPNQFAIRHNPEGYLMDESGNWVDSGGAPIINSKGVQYPGHYGRRCHGMVLVAGRHERCHHKWSTKQCYECQAENDIAARYCSVCKAEIVDPNDKLKEIAAKIASNPYAVQFHDVTSWKMERHLSPKGESLKVVYFIDGKPNRVSEWFHPESANEWLARRWRLFCIKAWGHHVRTIQDAIDRQDDAAMPSVVAFRKKAGTQWYEVTGTVWNNELELANGANK